MSGYLYPRPLGEAAARTVAAAAAVALLEPEKSIFFFQIKTAFSCFLHKIRHLKMPNQSSIVS